MSTGPRFDLSRLSWREGKRLSLLQMRLKEVSTAEEMEAAFAQMEAFLARVLVSVPRGWLVPDAPEGLDWSDPESLNWVQAGRVKAIVAALGEAQTPGEASGN